MLRESNLEEEQINHHMLLFFCIVEQVSIALVSFHLPFQILFQSKVPSIFDAITKYLHTFVHIFPFSIK